MNKKTNIVRVKGDDQAVARSIDFSEMINSFLDSQDIRSVSKEVYRKGLERLLIWLAENNIIQPDRQSILGFKVYLMESGLSANTVNCYLVGARRFFSYLEGSRLYPDIAKGIKGAAQPKGHLRDPLTASQIKEMLSAIDRSTLQGKRDSAMIVLMARTGLRTVSIVKANIEDIKQSGECVRLSYKGKGRDSKDAEVFLFDDSLKLIYSYLKARGKTKASDPLFVSHSDRNKNQALTTRTVSFVVKSLLRKIGVDSPKLSAHSLRHFRITDSVRKGASIPATQAMAGHASIETTMKYYHEYDRETNAAEKHFTPLIDS